MRRVALILLVAGIPRSVLAGETQVRRVATPSCWVRISDGCLTRPQWMACLENRLQKSKSWPDSSYKSWPDSSYESWHVSSVSSEVSGLPKTVSVSRRWSGAALCPLPPGSVTGPQTWLESLRERIGRRLEAQDSSGILRKLVLDEGDAGGSSGIARLLGFVHLFSVTGLHLLVLAACAHALVREGARRLHVPAGLGLASARAVSACLGFFAWALCGFRSGMLRPLLLIGLRSAARSQGIRWRSGHALAAGMAAELLFAGWTGWLGRIHYVLAVAGATLALDAGATRGGRWRIAARLAIGSWVLCALWECWRSGLVAWSTPALNLVSWPFYLISYPAAWLGGVFDVPVLISLSDRLMCGLLSPLLRFALAVPSIWVVSRSALVAGIVLASLLAITRSRSARASILGLALLLGSQLQPGAAGETRVEQLDVGQGDAALLRGSFPRSGSAGLIDAGSARALDEAEWLRLLARRGLGRVDWIALTHLDEDHAGGVLTLARVSEVGCVEMDPAVMASSRGVSLIRELGRLGVPVRVPEAGCFPFPSRAIPDRASGHANSGNRSMRAFWVPIAPGLSWVGLGDADEEQERAILPWLRRMRLAHPGEVILKVSHHGSRFSSSWELLSFLKPSRAWISCGVGNHFGHPTLDALARLRDAGARIERTDVQGTLSSVR
jgi:competence protein ComEC